MPFNTTAQLSSYSMKLPKRLSISEKEAKATAHRLLSSNKLSANQRVAIDLLASVGILTFHQLTSLVPLSARTLRTYHSRYFVDYHLAPSQIDVHELPQKHSHLRLYTLGAVGRAIAQNRDQKIIDYEGYAAHQIVHDILNNQAVVTLINAASQYGYAATIYGKYEAQVYGREHGQTKCLLEPDTLLIFRKDGAPKRAFVIEFHNEDHRGRAIEKVAKYERESRSHYWREAWPLDDFPIVLTCFHADAVMTGYEEGIDKSRGRGLKCRYFAKSIQRIIANDRVDTWFDLGQQKAVHLFR